MVQPYFYWFEPVSTSTLLFLPPFSFLLILSLVLVRVTWITCFVLNLRHRWIVKLWAIFTNKLTVTRVIHIIVLLRSQTTPMVLTTGVVGHVNKLRRLFHGPRLHRLEVAATGVLLSFASIFEELQRGVSTDALCSAGGFRSRAVHLSHDQIWHFRSTKRLPCRGQFLAVSTPGSIELNEEVCVCCLEKMERHVGHSMRKDQDQDAQNINIQRQRRDKEGCIFSQESSGGQAA